MRYMKIFLAVILFCALSALMIYPCVAADTFVPDFMNRRSPQVYLTKEESGVVYAGVFGDDISGPLAYLGMDNIQLYAYSERQFAPETVRDGLQNAYAIFNRVTSLGDLTPALDDTARFTDASCTSVAYVVSDLFDLSIPESMMDALMAQDGHYFELTFYYDFSENGLLPVCIHQDPVEKTWSVIDSSRITSRHSDTVTIKFDDLGLFAFLKLDPARMGTAGSTESAGLIWLGVLAIFIVFFGSVAILVTVTHRRSCAADGDRENVHTVCESSDALSRASVSSSTDGGRTTDAESGGGDVP